MTKETTIYGHIKDDEIFAQSIDGAKIVGVTHDVHNKLLQQYDDLLHHYNEYEEKLLHLVCPKCGAEFSEIEKPLSQDEINEMQMNTLKEIQGLLDIMRTEFANMKFLHKELKNEHKTLVDVRKALTERADEREQRERNEDQQGGGNSRENQRRKR